MHFNDVECDSDRFWTYQLPEPTMHTFTLSEAIILNLVIWKLWEPYENWDINWLI